jgi:hypothetical protein
VSQSELLILVAAVLEQVGVAYMVTGSIASAIHGEPRMTHDIDLVVAMRREDVSDVASFFQDLDFYADEESLAEAVARQDQCNFIHMSTGEKIDLWVLKNDVFDRTRFGRRIKVPFQDQSIWVSTAEDTILMKLIWDRQCGGSEKQRRDVLRVYEHKLQELDHSYLDEWAAKLGVQPSLAEIKKQAIAT